MQVAIEVKLAGFFLVLDFKNTLQLTFSYFSIKALDFLWLIFKVCENHESYLHHNVSIVHLVSISRASILDINPDDLP